MRSRANRRQIRNLKRNDVSEAESEQYAGVQRAYFEEAEHEHFRWTTEGPGFAETEDALLAPLLTEIDGPCLEIGCGEGNNLVRLAEHATCFGADLFPRKIRFAASEIPAAHFAVANAEQLPYPDRTFRSVLIRDLLHHIEQPPRVLEEAVRVLASGGRLFLLEPNARNPIVRLQVALVAAEAGARRFDARYFAGLLEGLPLEDIHLGVEQPFPLRRVVLHYQFGFPALGRFGPTRWLLRVAEQLVGMLIPRSYWCYHTAVARRR